MTVNCKDITGQRFGSLLAVRRLFTRNGLAHWEYQCDCGNTHTARANTVSYAAKKASNPQLPSCGCVEIALKTKHGFRRANDTHPAYKAYRAMMDRCYNATSTNYKWYGAVGVTVCSEWLNNPEAFVKWAIAHNWQPGLHIDKDILCREKEISPHIYSPETCQWVSAKINVGEATNRNNFGKHPNIRLSHQDVAEIERLYFSGEITNKSALARQFGLQSPSSISRLISQAKARSAVTR